VPVTSIRLQPGIEKTLEEAAEKLQRSKNWLINQAIKEFLQKETRENKRWQETLIALDSLNNGNVVEGASVHSWLESWGSETELEKPKK